MCNRSASVSRQQSTGAQSTPSDDGAQSDLTEEEITNQFRDYLIYGNTKEALGW